MHLSVSTSTPMHSARPTWKRRCLAHRWRERKPNPGFGSRYSIDERENRITLSSFVAALAAGLVVRHGGASRANSMDGIVRITRYSISAPRARSAFNPSRKFAPFVELN